MLRDVASRPRRLARRSDRWTKRRRHAPDKLLVGLEDIAVAAGVDVRTIWLWSDPDACDPLRLEYLHGIPRIRLSALAAWDRRRMPGNREKKIRGWKDICERVEMSRTAAWRAARPDVPDRLPVFTADGERPWAYAAALDGWKRSRILPVRIQRDRVRALRLAVGLLDAPPNGARAGAPASSRAQTRPSRRRERKVAA